MREVIITSILQRFDKETFFEGWTCFKFSNLGLVLGVALKFDSCVAKVVKLKARKYAGLILTFGEVTRENMEGSLIVGTLP